MSGLAEMQPATSSCTVAEKHSENNSPGLGCAVGGKEEGDTCHSEGACPSLQIHQGNAQLVPEIGHCCLHEALKDIMSYV